MSEIDLLKGYLESISKFKRITKEEEKDLILEIRKGSKEAKEKFVKANLKLVVKITREFRPNKEISIMDIIQNGNMGLIKAVERFEPERGLSFSNYASYWIKQSIIRGFQKSSFGGGASFRRVESYKRVIKFIDNYKKNKGRIPSINEIQKELKCDKNMVLDILATVQESGGCVSYSSMCEANDLLLENIADTSYNPEEIVEKKFIREDIEKAISSTSPRDRKIIKQRYYLTPLVGEKKSTLSSLSKEYSLSVEGIRQIEKRIFNYIKIKYPFLVNYLYS